MSQLWLGYLISVGLYFVVELYGLVVGITRGFLTIDIKGCEEDRKWLAAEFYSGLFVSALGRSFVWPLDVLTSAPKFARLVRDKFVPTTSITVGKDPPKDPAYEPLPDEALREMRRATEAFILKWDRKTVVRSFLHWAWMAFWHAEQGRLKHEELLVIFRELARRETKFVPDIQETIREKETREEN